MKKVIHFINQRLEEIIGIMGLAVTVSLIFVGVVMRVFFKSGIGWQEELSRILYVLVVYLGASYGIKSDDHICVTFMVRQLSPKGQRILRIITDLVWILFNLVIAGLSLDTYGRMRQTLGETAVLMIPLHYVFLIIPVGFILLTGRLIQVLWQRVQDFKKEKLS